MIDVVESLEVEPEEEVEENLAPIEYDITTYPSDFTLSVLYSMWEQGQIVIPDYQREFVWNIKQSSLLIESFLLGLPVPPVFFYIDEGNKCLVIDGQQRLLSVFYYLEGYFGRENDKGKRTVFKLTGLNEKSPFLGKRFENLSDKHRLKLEGAVLRAINVKQNYPNDDNSSVYYIFERLNTGGTPLQAQEIRDCIYRGAFLEKLTQLNNDANWRTLLGSKLQDKHRKDIELILRAFAFFADLESYEKPLKEFLNRAARKYRDGTDPLVARFEDGFLLATEVVVKKLPQKPFNVRGPLNKSVFDSVFCTLISNINDLPEDLDCRYEALLRDEKFIDYTANATTDAKVVKERFAYVKTILIG